MKFKYLLLIILIVLDQATKWFLSAFYPNLIIKNSGIIFGWVGDPFLFWLLVFLGFGALIWLLRESRKESQKLTSLLIILGGAISNLIDRVARGFVVDYFRFGNFSTLNSADIFIYAGIIVYGYQIFRYKFEPSNSKSKL